MEGVVGECVAVCMWRMCMLACDCVYVERVYVSVWLCVCGECVCERVYVYSAV